MCRKVRSTAGSCQLVSHEVKVTLSSRMHALSSAQLRTVCAGLDRVLGISHTHTRAHTLVHMHTHAHAQVHSLPSTSFLSGTGKLRLPCKRLVVGWRLLGNLEGPVLSLHSGELR